MAHLIDKHLIERAEAAVVLSTLWAALGACALGAAIYDVFTASRTSPAMTSTVAKRMAARARCCYTNYTFLPS
jgi:hypothetical protein